MSNLTETIAKWLACIIENGEAYDNFEKMTWSEFACGEEGADAMRSLAKEFLSLARPEIEREERERMIQWIERAPVYKTELPGTGGVQRIYSQAYVIPVGKVGALKKGGK